MVSATSAQAALYNIVEVTGVTGQGNEAYGVAVAELDGVTNCFTETCSADSVVTGNEIRNGADGFPFKDEAPFAYDNRFHILDEDDLKYYCDRERGYNSCENWKITQWFGSNGFGGLQRERDAYYSAYSANAKGFKETQQLMVGEPLRSTAVESSAPFVANSNNVVVTKFTQDGSVLGTTSSGYYDIGNSTYGVGYRERGFVENTILLPLQDAGIVSSMGRTMAFDSFKLPNNDTTYVIGSAAVASFNYSDSNKDYGGDLDDCPSAEYPGQLRQCQHFAFATKPYIWAIPDGSNEASMNGTPISSWAHGEETSNRNDYTSLASARAAAIATSGANYEGKPVLAGYNVERPDGDNNYGMQAGIYYPNSTFAIDSSTDTLSDNMWDFRRVSGAEIYDSGEKAYVYSNSRTTDINDNLIAIGESKLRYNRALNGALANRLFATNANTTGNPSADYFSGGIFFTGAGGKANAINNYNEVVGSIDGESAREDGGKQRRRRGFIYPLGDQNGLGDVASITSRSAIFQNSAWWIDDLTNDGKTGADTNNEFRIIEAGGINDAGVISATAIKCVGGYDTTSHNSYCGGGTQKELVVAVKLVPIQGATSANIMTRSADIAPVERQGAGIGVMLLGLFGIYLFRKRQ
jgi:hypothetical protein